MNERQVLIKSKHPYILKLRFAFQNSKFLFYVMDYMKGGPITKYIRGRGMDEAKTKYYAA